MKWKPIETAPKDSYVLLCLGGICCAIGRWAKTFDGEMWVNDDGTERTPFELNPTHWMPLPELPR